MNRDRAQAIIDLVGDRLLLPDPHADTGMDYIDLVDLILDEIEQEYAAYKVGKQLPKPSAHLTRLSSIKNAAEKLATLLADDHEAGYLEAGTMLSRNGLSTKGSAMASDRATFIRDLRVLAGNADVLMKSDELREKARVLRGALANGARDPQSAIYRGAISIWCELTGDDSPPEHDGGAFALLADEVFRLVGATPPNRHTMVDAIRRHKLGEEG